MLLLYQLMILFTILIKITDSQQMSLHAGKQRFLCFLGYVLVKTNETSGFPEVSPDSEMRSCYRTSLL